jgi:uncharacterized membrane protein
MGPWTDRRMERFIGQILLAGVLLATALVLAGAALHLARHGGDHPDFRTFDGEPLALRSAAGIVRSALEPTGRGLIQLGLLVLVATPVARVAFSTFAFLAQHDRTYVAITLTVLAVLGLAVFWGRA